MKNYIKLFGIIALAAVIVFSMAACKKSGSSAPTVEPAASISSGNSVDKLLADYEKFIDDYASLMQKVKAGDTSVTADAQKFESEVKEWAAKWDGLPENDFTPEQARRLIEINQKFTASLGL